VKLNYLFTLAILAAGVSHAAAIDPLLQNLRDEYNASRPWNMTLRTIVMGENERAVAAEIIIGAPGCSGAFSGLGTSDGKVLKIRPYKAEPDDGGQCVLSIKLDKSGKIATVSEDSCTYFHGAQCEFSGKLSAK